jgi:hypothetical protein
MSNVTYEKILKNEANYWLIEANHFHSQWLNSLKELEKYRWQPIETAPFKQRVIVLFSSGQVATMIFDTASDFKTTYSTHWIPLPPLPKQ